VDGLGNKRITAPDTRYQISFVLLLLLALGMFLLFASLLRVVVLRSLPWSYQLETDN
jgi:hypothetical protein